MLLSPEQLANIGSSVSVAELDEEEEEEEQISTRHVTSL